MIVGIGTDVIEIQRVQKAVEQNRFLARNFTEQELALFETKNVQTIAGNFAGKESVAKAFGTGIRGFGLKDIEILRNEYGRPYVVLYGHALEIAKELGVSNIQISISHCQDYAVAFVVLEG